MRFVNAFIKSVLKKGDTLIVLVQMKSGTFYEVIFDVDDFSKLIKENLESGLFKLK